MRQETTRAMYIEPYQSNDQDSPIAMKSSREQPEEPLIGKLTISVNEKVMNDAANLTTGAQS